MRNDTPALIVGVLGGALLVLGSLAWTYGWEQIMPGVVIGIAIGVITGSCGRR